MVCQMQQGSYTLGSRETLSKTRERWLKSTFDVPCTPSTVGCEAHGTSSFKVENGTQFKHVALGMGHDSLSVGLLCTWASTQQAKNCCRLRAK